MLVDVNDCNMNNGHCEQICRNTPGGKECGCRPGYMLNLDGLTCSGECLLMPTLGEVPPCKPCRDSAVARRLKPDTCNSV